MDACSQQSLAIHFGRVGLFFFFSITGTRRGVEKVTLGSGDQNSFLKALLLILMDSTPFHGRITTAKVLIIIKRIIIGIAKIRLSRGWLHDSCHIISNLA